MIGRSTRNGLALAMEELPADPPTELREKVAGLREAGGRLVALLAAGPSARELLVIMARDDTGRLSLLRTALDGPAYPALTPLLPQAQAFERDVWERHGIVPEGHPWLKPLRRHADLETPPCPNEAHRFFAVAGPGIHEVAVGPVHAGVIEPGHFRFQCAGETVLHLEIQLGYQHRGAEALLLRSPPARRLVVVESIAGDTAVGHALAHAAAEEGLAGIEVPLRAQAIRGIALELERLANHTGDLGALCNDIGYLPGTSWFGRLRGEFLNLLMDLSGNRFGRGLLRPGGVRFDLVDSQLRDFGERLTAAERDLGPLVELTFGSPVVGSRFEQAGALARETAEALGMVGLAARASGCDRDVRRDHPSGVYRFAHIPVAVAQAGDVMARALVRSVEAKRALTFVREQIDELPAGPIAVDSPQPRAGRVVVALVEGWRGEIAHVAQTDAKGRLALYRVIDPSLHNWFGLTMALRAQPISDFPLCNKSFNLSYAGHDL